MKRFLIIFMCLSLFLCLLVSCGGEEGTGSSSQSRQDAQSSGADSKDEEKNDTESNKDNQGADSEVDTPSTKPDSSASTDNSGDGSTDSSNGSTDSSNGSIDSSSGNGGVDNGGFKPDLSLLKYQYDMGEYITLPSYNGHEVSVSLDEIQRAIDSYVMQYASNSKKTVCMTGDVVKITYFGYRLDENGDILYENGKEVIFDEGDTGVYLGAHLFLDEFEKGIAGMKIGDIKEIYVTFPKDYFEESLAGERVIFEVILNAIYEPPVYSQDFIKTYFPEFNTTEEFENSLISDFILNEIYDYVEKNAVIISYPEKEYNAVADELKELEKNFKEQYGIDLDSYIMSYYGMTRDEYIKNSMKAEMIYYAIANAEGIEATDEELAAERSLLIEYYTDQYVTNGVDYREAVLMAQEFVDDLGISYVYENVIFEKIDKKLVDLAITVEVPMSYKSVTQYLSERLNAETGSQIGDLCPSFEAEVFDESGSLSTALDPTKNVGKLTVINFWGTWCGPCKNELPDFDRVAAEYGDQVTVFAVHSSYNFKDASEYVLENFKDSNIIFLKDVIINPNDQYSDDMFYALLGGADYYPYTVILDENGVIRGAHVGMLSYDQLVNILVNIGLER